MIRLLLLLVCGVGHKPTAADSPELRPCKCVPTDIPTLSNLKNGSQAIAIAVVRTRLQLVSCAQMFPDENKVMHSADGIKVSRCVGSGNWYCYSGLSSVSPNSEASRSSDILPCEYQTKSLNPKTRIPNPKTLNPKP